VKLTLTYTHLLKAVGSLYKATNNTLVTTVLHYSHVNNLNN